MTVNEGVLAEQFVAQELIAQNQSFMEPELFYWLREGRSSNAEVDFIIQHQNKIYPLEVKAGKTGTLKSLHLYLYEKKLQTGLRLNTDLPSTGEFRVEQRMGSENKEINYKLISLPLYLTAQIQRILDHVENL